MTDLTKFQRRPTCEVRIGCVRIGAGNPVAVQSMTNTDTNDTAASVAQIERIDRAGGPIVRLTAQGRREGENLANIVRQLRGDGFRTAVVADIHFVPEVAAIAAKYVDKVRINPGNYRTEHGELEALIEQCRERGVALRIGVNHGSLARRVFDRYGDTPEGMVVSAMEFLRVCRERAFDQVVVSMKSSNTRVTVPAYRPLVAAMEAEGMNYPIHLGVTEAGNGLEGRIKSAVGIGALLCDGIGDTIRVSLTEAPENEIPVARLLVEHFADRPGEFPVRHPERYSPYVFRRRSQVAVPVTHDEPHEGFRVIEALSGNPTAELRAAILNLDRADEPVVVKRRYEEALNTLRDYDDRNTAIAYMSLGYNKAAYRVLMAQPNVDWTAEEQYLLAIIAARLGDEQEAVQHFLRACELRSNLKFRGNLDPELSYLIRKYGLDQQDFQDNY